jgi:hypothetical protein
VTVAGRIRWKLSMRLETRSGPFCTPQYVVGGTFTLARAGSADSVTGTVVRELGLDGKLVMKVVSGTGAYAGLTDASSGGTTQAFSHPTVESIVTGIDLIDGLVLDTITALLTGCGGPAAWFQTPDYVGSLDFHLV